MKRKINKTYTILIVLLSIFIEGCSIKSEPYNLLIINNSGDSFKSIGFQQEHSSGGVSNADNSFIESGDGFKMYMESNEFSLTVIDTYGNEIIRQKFNVDFSNNKNKVYKIYIEKDFSGSLEFILIE